MADPEQHNFYRLVTLIFDTGRDVLDEFFKKKLERMQLRKYLDMQKHKFLHSYKTGKCCQCGNAKESSQRIFIHEGQWKLLYNNEATKHCEKKKLCVCQFSVNTSVFSRDFDVTLLCVLILNSNSFSVNATERYYVERIRQYRNKLLAHPSSQKARATHEDFKKVWQDLELSIVQVARFCSVQYSAEVLTKIKFERDKSQSYEILCSLLVKVLNETTYSKQKDEVSETTVVDSAVENSIRNMKERLPQQQWGQYHYGRYQNSSIDIDDIDSLRNSLSNQVIKDKILQDLEPTPVIRYLLHRNIISETQRQNLLNSATRNQRCYKLLELVTSNDDKIVRAFMDALKSTNQHIVIKHISREADADELHVIFELKPTEGQNVVLRMDITNQPEMESRVVTMMTQERDPMNELVERFSKLKLDDVEEGSIIIRLKPDTSQAMADFYRAYLKGELKDMIQSILASAGVLDKIIDDKITVKVTIMASVDQMKADTAENLAQKKFYEDHTKYLSEEISPTPVAALLSERGVLNDEDLAVVFQPGNHSRLSKVQSLLEILKTKDFDTTEDFKQCLYLTAQEYIIQEMSKPTAAEANGVQKQVEISISPPDSGLFTDKVEIEAESATKESGMVQPSPECAGSSNIETDKHVEQKHGQDEDQTLLYSDLLGIVKSNLHNSVGLIELTGQGANYGTGFRVGTNYVMTAYHAFKDKIDFIRNEIYMALHEHFDEQSSHKLLGKLSTILKQEEPTHVDNHTIVRWIGLYFEHSLPQIPFMEFTNILKGAFDENQALLSNINKLINVQWNDAVKITFAKLDVGRTGMTYCLDPNIIFGNADNDVIILQVNSDVSSLPRPLHLCREETVSTINIIGHPKDERRRLKGDFRCPVYTNESSLRQDIAKAVAWWNANFPEEAELNFRSEYENCDPKMTLEKGNAVLHASKSFTNGASGSPMFFVDEVTNAPIVAMMYLRGYPGFYYQANSSYTKVAKHLEKFANIKVPSENLFAVGVTTGRVFSLLQENNLELCNNIYKTSQ